ncbi:unnamed protein product [Peronospora belbahrii]|uniref:TPX2 central domain-containing protein n=1 Tax=Peronospora belbahrii TaxID=622444 RepID=A0ABN8DBP8_9STRA|nr:unnamed protein product [Peronospora belbahrii]
MLRPGKEYKVEAKNLESPPRQHRLRLNSVPIANESRMNSISNRPRDCNKRGSRPKPSTGSLASGNTPNQWSAANVTRMSSQTDVTGGLTADLLRRHTSALPPVSWLADFTKQSSKPSRAVKQLLRVNATEPQTTKRHSKATELHALRREVPTSYSCDFTQKYPVMVVHNGISTSPKEAKHSMTDLRSVSKSQSCDLTGDKPSNKQNGIKPSTVGLRRTEHTINIPGPTMRGRRASVAYPSNSSPTRASLKHYAVMAAKRGSAQRDSKRCDDYLQEKKKQSHEPKTTKNVLSAGSDNILTSKKTGAPLIDFHLSTVGLRPRSRRHTTAGALTQNMKPMKHGNQEPVAEEVDIHDDDRFARFRQKKKAEVIDFHLSRFNLTSRRLMAEAESASDNVKVGHRDKEKQVTTVPATLEQMTSKHLKNEPCDLAYLEKFRSLTL